MSLIGNKADIDFFAKHFLQENHGYMFPVSVVARKKYDASLPLSNMKMFSGVFENNTTFFQFMHQCDSVRVNESVSLNAMVTYVFLNPRTNHLAGCEITKTLNAQLLDHAINGGNSLFSDVLNDIHSSLCKSTHVKKYYTIDLDRKDLYTEVRALIMDVCEPRIIIETHGGYHFIIDWHVLKQPEWRQIHEVMDEINARENAEVIELLRDPQIPVPGTYQGGFLVTVVQKHFDYF